MNETQVTHDWTAQLVPMLLLPIALYAIGLFILFFVVRTAVKSGIKAGTSEQQRQSAILNRLLAEQLKAQGVSADQVQEILAGR